MLRLPLSFRTRYAAFILSYKTQEKLSKSTGKGSTSAAPPVPGSSGPASKQANRLRQPRNRMVEDIAEFLRIKIPSFLSRVSPEPLVEEFFRFHAVPQSIPLPEALISLGKAAGGLTISFANTFNIPPDKTLTVLPDGYPSPSPDFPALFGPHPFPSQQSLRTLGGIRNFIESLPGRMAVAVAISGGSSSLVADPVFPVSVEEKALMTQRLMEAGAPIEVINNLRIHLSRIKGGGLASLLFPRPSITYLFSDIPGEAAALVGSSLMFPTQRNGPLMLQILERWLDRIIPQSIRQALSETPLLDFSDRISPQSLFGGIIASSETLLPVAMKVFIEGSDWENLPRHLLTGELRGEAREAGKVLASQILWNARRTGEGSVWLCSGETTVRMEGKKIPGRGGRSLELGLSLAMALSPINAAVLSLATDGWDGNSSLAGMVATTRPLADPILAQEASQALDSHDTAPFLERRGMAVKTGKTGSNLNDLLVVVVSDP